MALSPQSLALTKEELEIVRQYERIIDEELPILPVTPQRKVECSCFKHPREPGRSLTRRIAEEVVRRYKAAGWTDCAFGDGFVTLTIDFERD